MGKTFAITGINGYFASTILPRLQADPEVERIIGVDLAPWKGGFDKVRFYKADIRSDRMSEILKGVDVLYHLALTVGAIHDKHRTRDLHVNGSKNVFAACVGNSVKKVIYTSSTTVYDSHAADGIGFAEESPLSRYEDDCYRTSKVEVEDFIAEFRKNHPEITITVIRAAILVGPNIEHALSHSWLPTVTALPMGCATRQQFIHEEDLGEALYLAQRKDIHGIFNVTADDSVTAKWCFETAGTSVVPLPRFLLKPMAKVGLRLGLSSAGGDQAIFSNYTVFGLNDKFKKAAGWEPKYTSEQAFMTYIRGRERDPDRRDDLTHALLSWGSRKSRLLRLLLGSLDVVFRMAKVPWIRSVHPWMAPEKNSISYLPINERLGPANSAVLPPQAVFDFIQKASIRVVMDTCGCRTAHHCENFTNAIGCLFMGESALELPAGASRRVTKEQALEHARRAIGLGLVPMVGKVRVDNFLMMTPDRDRLLTVCFCCHCCCMMRYFKHIPTEQLDQILLPIGGLSVEVTDDCTGCGTCVEYCVFDAITIEDGVSVHSSKCRGCGRCETNCPQGAVKISIANPNAVADVERRIESYLEGF